jgi:hypothetical protein
MMEVAVKSRIFPVFRTGALLAPALLAVLALALTRSSFGQGSKTGAASAKSQPTPRTADGKPDLSGFWQGPLLRNMFEASGGPQFTPEGKAAYDYNLTKSENPEGLCLFAGIPRASISGVPFEISQSAHRVAFLYELMTAWRSVPIDGSPRAKNIPDSFFGNGVGHWEGDTLVIDSIGFKDYLSWADDDAHPHSGAMHVVERWTRTDWDHLAHEVTVEDPKFYTKPWTFKRVFTSMPPGQQPMEYACDENNLDRNHLGAGPQPGSR